MNGNSEDLSHHQSDTTTRPSSPRKSQRNFRRDGRKFSKPYAKELPKAEKPTVSLLAPTRQFWHYYVNTTGLRAVCDTATAVLKSRDRLMRTYLTEPLLRYVTNICMLNRLIQCNVDSGLQFPPDVYRIHSVAKTIKLPPLIARYVESVGRIDLTEGPSLIPYCPKGFEDLQSDHFYDHTLDVPAISAHMRRINRGGFLPAEHQAEDDQEGDAPADPQEVLIIPVQQPTTEWRIREDIVTFYNSNSRAYTLGLKLRPVQFEEHGRPEALVCSRTVGQGDAFTAMCSRQIPEEQGLCGGAFRYRNNTPVTWIECNGNIALQGGYFCSHSHASRNICLTDMMIRSLSFE